MLFIPVVLLGKAWFGLTGIIWALTTTEVAVLLVGLTMLITSRGAIERGLEQGSQERAEALVGEARRAGRLLNLTSA